MPRLSRRIWLFEAGILLSSVGLGLVIPFQAIYLHNVRGFSLGTTGAVLATIAATALVGGFAAGAAVDRFGPRRVAMACTVVQGSGYAALSLVHHPWQGFVVCTVVGLGLGGFVPTQGSLVAALANPEQRHSTYSIEFAATNLGFAVGAAVAGSIATTTNATSFVALFLLAGAALAAYAVVVALVVPRAPSGDEEEEPEERARYRDVLRQRAVLGFAGVIVLLAAAGIAVWEVAVPVFAKNEGGLDEGDVGLIFIANSVAIVLAQLPVAKLLEGRRRMQALAVAMALWVCAWGLAAATGAIEGTEGVALWLGVGVLFALGECVIAPMQASLVVDIAPPALQGRCLALTSNAFGVGLTIGPAAVGAVLAHAAGAVWPFAAAVLILAGVAALLLERVMPEAARRAPRSGPEVA